MNLTLGRSSGLLALSFLLLGVACTASDHGADAAVDGAVARPDGSVRDASLAEPDGAVLDGGRSPGSDAGLLDAGSTTRGMDAGGPDAGRDAGGEAQVDAGGQTKVDAGAEPVDAGAQPVDAGGASDADAGSSQPQVVPPPVCGCPAGTDIPHGGYADIYGSADRYYHPCLALDEPTTGCGKGAPCSLPHASAQCAAGACAVRECDEGWGDCSDDGNGCGTDLNTSTAHCGECGHGCGAGESCVYGVCASGCEPPRTECSGGVCADLLTSVSNCGDCGHVCTAPASQTPVCNAGTCGTVTDDSCPPDRTVCNGKCVDLDVDLLNCGACGHACPPSNGRNACIEGECQPCAPGLTACGTTQITCEDTARSNSACGACGVACTSDELCIDSACEPLAALKVFTGMVSDFAVHGGSIFVLDTNAGTVSRVATTGGDVTLLASGQAKPMYIVAADGYAYWTNNLGAAVMRVSAEGGTPALVAAGSQPSELVVDASNVYWLNDADLTVRSRPRDGSGSSVTLYTSTSRDLSRLRQTSTHLVFMDWFGTTDSYEVMRVAKSGGAAQQLFWGSNAADPITIAASDGYLYWTGHASFSPDYFAYRPWGGSETGMNPGGGSYNGSIYWTLTISNPSQTTRAEIIVPDGDDVLYRSIDGIRKASHCDNRGPSLMADVSATLFTVDDTHFYWSDGSAIYRVHK